MAEELEISINSTKALLQPLFSKPKLSTKLLSKPPFRFIHDIVTATIDSTGFPDGLFDVNELKSSTYKDDKAAKLAFLDKLIHLVSVGEGSALDVNSSKIVAGMEPLKTNDLLRSFGRLALNQELDRSALIQHCRDGLSIEEYKQQHSAPAPDIVESSEESKSEAPSPSIEPRLTDNSGLSLLRKINSCNEDMEQTIQMISRIVSKPKCSEKLLSKPPFRYLHDLFMAIAHATEFDLSRVFSVEELNSANIKEKHNKLDFLDKLVCFLSDKTGVSIDVKPSKIVAGLESERTRYLLQVYTVVAETKEAHASTSVSLVDEPLREENKSHNEEKALDTKPKISTNEVDVTSPVVMMKSSDAESVVQEEKIESSPLREETTDLETSEEFELPDFESWLGHTGESKDLEETKSTISDIQPDFKCAIKSRPAMSLMLTSKLSATDLESISAAVEGITELTSSIGHLMGLIGMDMEAMRKERDNWANQIK